MKKEMVFCALMGLAIGIVNCAPILSQKPSLEVQQLNAKPEGSNRDWGTATYKGLIIGKSTRADMLRVLGEPEWSGPPSNQGKVDQNPEIWNTYKGSGDFPGQTTVVIDKHSSVILSIDLYPEALSKEEAIRRLGDHYIKTRYDLDMCLSTDGGESAPLYESPNGEIEIIEYRSRGIAIRVNYQGNVDHIQYVNKPIGTPSSKCSTGHGVQ